MKKIGISTVFTGYNYGSALQAYATKCLVEKLGYEGVVIKQSGSMVKGHDIRLKKTFVIAAKTFLNPSNAKKNIGAYKQSFSISIPEKSRQLFDEFINEKISPQIKNWGNLKKEAQSKEFVAFICGSDQIWNADTFFVDPFYYLQYAPEYKRIAFAPSFGRESIPEYNRKTISRYISGIPYLSVREESGAQIIENLLHRSAEVLIDPTLILSRSDWESRFNLKDIIQKRYLLAYFLNEPTEKTKKAVKEYARDNGLTVVGIPYDFGDGFADSIFSAGPVDFLSLVKNAAAVCTDSFHGTAFSINFGIPFYTFERNYGSAGSQSTRISSLLKMTGMENRFCKANTIENNMIDFAQANRILDTERQKAVNYLSDSINKIINRVQ